MIARFAKWRGVPVEGRTAFADSSTGRWATRSSTAPTEVTRVSTDEATIRLKDIHWLSWWVTGFRITRRTTISRWWSIGATWAIIWTRRKNKFNSLMNLNYLPIYLYYMYLRPTHRYIRLLFGIFLWSNIYNCLFSGKDITWSQRIFNYIKACELPTYLIVIFIFVAVYWWLLVGHSFLDWSAVESS